MPFSEKGGKGSIASDAYPNLFSGICLSNLIIKDKNNKLVKASSHPSHTNNYQLKTEEQIDDYLKKIMKTFVV